jgi:hypothetical protein
MNQNGISHYLIIESKEGFCIRGHDHKGFTDLKSLVTHCSVMRDILPVVLDIDHYNTNKTNANKTNNYSSLSPKRYNSGSSIGSSISSGSDDFADLNSLVDSNSSLILELFNN